MNREGPRTVEIWDCECCRAKAEVFIVIRGKETALCRDHRRGAEAVLAKCGIGYETTATNGRPLVRHAGR